MSFEAFNALSPAALRALASALRDGALSGEVSYRPIEQIAGTHTSGVADKIRELRSQGMTPQQIGLLVAAIAETRECIPDPSLVFELVISGPPFESIPTQHTGAVVHTLFADARDEVLVAGYAIYNGEDVFGPLHDRLVSVPALVVKLFFDIARRESNASDGDIVNAFKSEFIAKHWPWPELPGLYFYPRSLERAASERGSLHAKCVIVDRKTAFITSANFTEAAQQRNLEVGLLIRHSPLVARLAAYFDGMVASAQIKKVPLA